MRHCIESRKCPTENSTFFVPRSLVGEDQDGAVRDWFWLGPQQRNLLIGLASDLTMATLSLLCYVEE